MSDVFALEKLSTAKRMIAEANTVPEAKLLLDQFSALADLAKRQKLELGILQDIGASQLWTRRKLGVLLADMPKNGGTKGQFIGPSKLEVPKDDTPTLAEVGISYADSSRLQAEAKIPSVVVEEYVQETKERGEVPIAAGLQRKAKALVSDSPAYDGDEWHTPAEYIGAARDLMGEIELDPATCETAQVEVKATHYLTKQDDALQHPWFGRVWMNPPYSYPLVEWFVDKLIAEFDQGNVTEAIVLVNNSSDTGWFHKLLSRFPACFTRGRVQFWHPQHEGFATRQGQTFFYLGPDWKAEIFGSVFSRFGIVVEVV